MDFCGNLEHAVPANQEIINTHTLLDGGRLDVDHTCLFYFRTLVQFPARNKFAYLIKCTPSFDEITFVGSCQIQPTTKYSSNIKTKYGQVR